MYDMISINNSSACVLYSKLVTNIPPYTNMFLLGCSCDFFPTKISLNEVGAGYIAAARTKQSITV